MKLSAFKVKYYLRFLGVTEKNNQINKSILEFKVLVGKRETEKNDVVQSYL